MSTAKMTVAGCLLFPVLLIGSCAAKMGYDSKMYQLPGAVLKSSARPTQTLGSALQVAQMLDLYVQPRFEILRDKNFGALRIVFRKHAGLVQLKVDTPREQALIANVNAARRDYAISLLHCAPVPKPGRNFGSPKLQLLYFNQKQVATDWEYNCDGSDVAANNRLDWTTLEQNAIAALPVLMTGREKRTKLDSWDILMRPVLAANQECLSCHENTRPGATLGVMVYAVRSVKNDAAARIGLR